MFISCAKIHCIQWPCIKFEKLFHFIQSIYFSMRHWFLVIIHVEAVEEPSENKGEGKKMNPLSSLLCMLIIAKESKKVALFSLSRSGVILPSEEKQPISAGESCTLSPCPHSGKKKGNPLVLLQLIRVNYVHSALYPSSGFAHAQPASVATMLSWLCISVF